MDRYPRAAARLIIRYAALMQRSVASGLVLLMLPLLMVGGCWKPQQASYAKDMVGLWEDNSGARYTMEKVQGRLTVTAVIDSDGEVFPVQEQGWEEGNFYWVYLVPSTGYVVRHLVRAASPNRFEAEWSNQYDSGNDSFYKVGQ